MYLQLLFRMWPGIRHLAIGAEHIGMSFCTCVRAAFLISQQRTPPKDEQDVDAFTQPYVVVDVGERLKEAPLLRECPAPCEHCSTVAGRSNGTYLRAS